METLRDTAFGKLVRLATRSKWMQYPEEKDLSTWTEYLKTETKEEGESTTETEDGNPEDLEACGIYTVMSQCSTRPRRVSCASTIGGPNQSIVISWRGPDDPEVRDKNVDSTSHLGIRTIETFEWNTNWLVIEPAKLELKKEILR